MFENLNLRGWFTGLFSSALAVSKQNYYQNIRVDKSVPIIIDLNDLFKVYQSCPPLQTVINKKAEMLSNGILELRRKADGEKVEKHWAIDLMQNPNPLQNTREFIYEYSILNDIYSNSFIYRNSAFAGSNPKTLWNLFAGKMKIIQTGKWLDQLDMNGIIERFELWNMDDQPIRKFTTDEVRYINTGISENPLVAQSKLISLQFPISNIIGALRTRNLFIYYGPKMLVSAKNSDSESSLPLGKEEKERIERDFNQTDYGLQDSQSHTVVSTATLTASKMSYPTKDLMLFEEIEDDFNMLCGAFGMDRDIFPSTKGATFENKKNGEIATYQNSISVSADTFCDFLNQLLNLTDVEFVLSYDHLSIMKEDELMEAQSEKAEAETCSIMLKDGVISKQQYAELMDITYTATGDDTSQEDKIKNAQVELRGTVGGVTGLISINTAVSMGQLDRTSAIQILINVYGFDESTANAMITQTINGPAKY